MTLGDIMMHLDEIDKCLEYLDESIQLSKKSSSYVSYCMGLNLKAHLYLKQDKEDIALELVHETLKYAQEYQMDREKKYILDSVIEYYEKKKEPAKAYPFMKIRLEQSEKEIKMTRDENYRKIASQREKEIRLLEEKNDEIGTKNLLLEQFAHIISHDLKEPIRNIVSFAHLLERRMIGKLDDEVGEFLKFIVEGARNMNQNLTRLLDFTTLKQLEDKEKQPIYISDLIHGLTPEYEDIIEPFKVQIDYEGDVLLNMVPEHAIALFDEIIRNSIKFRKKGENCNIKITAKQLDGSLKVSLRDFGIGIEPEYQKKIFKIFNRLNKKEYDGAGVGLAICERIVNIYKGDIWMESKRGKGTVVHFTIPN